MLFGSLFSPLTTHAQAEDPDMLGLQYGEETGLTRRDPRIIAAQIINVVLSLLGVISLVLIVYAGFLWMTSAGNSDQADKAKSIIFASVIGLAIILTAYSISTFVVRSLYRATTGLDYRG